MKEGDILTEIKISKVLKELRKLGFKEKSINGDHHKFEDEKGHVTVVPYSKCGDTLPIGTYKAILKQIGK